jgi:hypothetical protein
MGSSSHVSSGEVTERRNVMAPDAGGNSTKKSLERTLAVICEGAEETQEISSFPGIRGTRLARTMTSESAQTHTTAACARVGRHGRGIRSDSIRTPPSEHLSQLPFYTRGAERESRPGQSQVLRTKRRGLARVSTLLSDRVCALTACRRQRCNHWRSAYRRGRRPVWGQRFDW